MIILAAKTAKSTWDRIPPQHRQRIVQSATTTVKTQGPIVAKKAADTARTQGPVVARKIGDAVARARKNLQ